MADGSSVSLGRVCPADVEEIEEEIDEWAKRHQASTGEVLQRMWVQLSEEAVCEREIGRFSGVQSPSVLLAFLRQLTNQEWRFAVSLACSSQKASTTVVRVMQFDPEAACTPLRRDLAEQLAGQPTDAMRELSSILARHTEKCWGEACREKAGAASSPLIHGATSRVGRLRAYGNAVNAKAAEIFIRSYARPAKHHEKSDVGLKESFPG
jgi:tetrahydromethanopterin S-methyltransferase subunit G